MTLGGEIRTLSHVDSLAAVPRHRAALLDLAPRQILAIDGATLPVAYRKQLARYRYGPGIFKVDWALDAPIPWTAEPCRSAGTIPGPGCRSRQSHSTASLHPGAWPGRFDGPSG